MPIQFNAMRLMCSHLCRDPLELSIPVQSSALLTPKREGQGPGRVASRRWRAGAACPLSCSPSLAARCTAFLRPALRRADCRCWPERTITFFARWWWRRRARSVARRVLCAAPDAALRVPSVVPDAFPHAPLAVPDAARYQTSPYLQAAASARWA